MISSMRTAGMIRWRKNQSTFSVSFLLVSRSNHKRKDKRRNKKWENSLRPQNVFVFFYFYVNRWFILNQSKNKRSFCFDFSVIDVLLYHTEAIQVDCLQTDVKDHFVEMDSLMEMMNSRTSRSFVDITYTTGSIRDGWPTERFKESFSVRY